MIVFSTSAGSPPMEKDLPFTIVSSVAATGGSLARSPAWDSMT
jgi:hypothetical protein